MGIVEQIDRFTTKFRFQTFINVRDSATDSELVILKILKGSLIENIKITQIERFPTEKVHKRLSLEINIIIRSSWIKLFDFLG